MKEVSEPRHLEPHLKESSVMRDFVFGFGDGINTSLGIAAGVGGADFSSNIIILAALVGMVTGAKAMAVQNYLAIKIQKELLKSEIVREEWEIENKPEDERMEIADIYKAKGFSGKELDLIVEKITSDKNGINLQGEVLYDNNIIHTISKFAQFKKCNLIVMGFRWIDSPREKFLGSKSHGVINISKIPVLIVK